MQEAIKTVMSVIQNKDYKTYCVGIHALYDYLFPQKNKAIIDTDIILVSECPLSLIKEIFVNHVENQDNIMICFGGLKMYIYNISLEDYFNKQFVNNLCIAKNNIGQFVFGNHFDNKTKNVQLLNIDKINDVDIVLQIVEFVSIVGLTIHKDYIKYLKNLFKYVNNNTKNKIGKFLNKILLNKYYVQALMLMNKLGIFKSCLQTISSADFEQLKSLKVTRNNIVEVWALIYLHTDINQIEKELTEIQMFENDELAYIKWIVKNFALCQLTSDNIKIRQSIYNTTFDLPLQCQNIYTLHHLITKANKIYKLIYNKDNSKILLYNLACRPYFINQLNVNLNQEQKQVLLQLLLKEENYPIDDKAMKNFIASHGDELGEIKKSR